MTRTRKPVGRIAFVGAGSGECRTSVGNRRQHVEREDTLQHRRVLVAEVVVRDEHELADRVLHPESC